jgi:nucleotide-binding universal stress UspA family protein
MTVEELRLSRLLVAVDGSENAALALSAAVTAARRDHAAITLIGVAPDVRCDARLAMANVDPGSLQTELDAEAQRVLREAVAALPEDLPVTTLFRRGKAGPAIVAAAAEQPYDAILVGARGLGRVGALIGSVSQHVLHHADVAVFVAHAPRATPAG